MASTDGIESVISEQIKTLIRIKADIASAIVSLGGNVSNNDTFASYADKIRDLDPKKNLDLGTLNITSNGSYSASAEGMDGFSSVTVNVTDSSGGSGGSGSGGSGSGGSGGYGDDSYEEDLPVYTVTFTNPEDPDFENVEVEVKYGGNAEYTGSIPTKSGNYKFVKWEPVPLNVQENMTCKAIFRNLNAEIEDSWIDICNNRGANYEIGEYKTLPIGAIRWVNQCIMKIPPYPDNSNITIHGNPYHNVKVIMVKVAENEDGSTSTWLAKTGMYVVNDSNTLVVYPMRVINKEDSGKNSVLDYDHVYNNMSEGSIYADKNKYPIINWETSDLRSWLNNEVINKIPEPIRSTIVAVKKRSNAIDADQMPLLGGVITTDKLWIPSYSELMGTTASDIDEAEFRFYDGVDMKLPAMMGGMDNPESYQYGYWTRSKSISKNLDLFLNWDLRYESIRSWHEYNSRIVRLGFCL